MTQAGEATTGSALTAALSAPPVYSSGYGAWILFLIIVMMTSNYVYRTIARILNPPIKEEFALTDFQLGLRNGPALAFPYIVTGAPISWRRSFTSPEDASRAVSPASRRLPASRNSFDQL